MGSRQFCYPVLPLKNYVVWDGCGFLDPKYLRYEKSQHPGVDWNAPTGGDTDLGAPVYAIADGMVSHSRMHTVWGNIVVINHDGEAWSQYAHLDQRLVRAGQRVRMGQKIGTIGKGGPTPTKPRGRYDAHLHFEIRRTNVPADEWPSATMPPSVAADYIRKTRVDPVKFLQQVGALTVPPAAHIEDIPATPITVRPRPEPPEPERKWEPVYDPATQQPIAGLWVSLWRHRTTGQGRIYRVPAEKLKAKGLK